MEGDRIEMSQREGDVLKVMGVVVDGRRTHVEAARLLGLSVRQVRRIRRRMEKEGDSGLIHKLRGRPSNRRIDGGTRSRAVSIYYTIRYANRLYQILPPPYPGLRGGKVVVELRRDGSLRLRFKDKYLQYTLIESCSNSQGALPPPPGVCRIWGYRQRV